MASPVSKPVITLDQLIALNDEIAALIRAGVPLDRGLRSLGQDLPGRLGRFATQLSAQLARGESLTDALAEPKAKLPRLYRAVIEAAGQKAQWLANAKGDGVRGSGIGFARYKNIGNYVAVVARVIIKETVRVEHVVAAVDCGRVVNPDGVINQAEGGIVQAISWTLKEQLRFDRTRISSRDWDSYPILTFDEAPTIETVLLDRPDEAWLGVGEGMVGPTAAAVGNAVFNAMGIRVRTLPITRERILAAMEQ